ncbi:hypothetical protein [Salmonella enterica]|uniref:hypothetical protein n=1 Tax=Salmonella enterica TaxID=28901 RepID=UPI0009B0C5D0|nr:hypothetical protein [Salmonella enterica]EBS2232031.1 hypothetical protein [Salmonella enterica subsp. enterica serovar Middlesbrough]
MEFVSLPYEVQTIAARLLSDRMQFSVAHCESKSAVAIAQEIKEAFVELYSSAASQENNSTEVAVNEREKLTEAVSEVYIAIDRSLRESITGKSTDDVKKILQLAADAAKEQDGTRFNFDAIYAYLATVRFE